MTTKIRMRMLEDSRTQYEIAAAAKVAPARLSEYALGKRAIPSQHIYRLCQTLGCNVQDLLGFVDDGEDDEAYIDPFGVLEH